MALASKEPHDENLQLAKHGTYLNLLSGNQIVFIYDNKQNCYNQSMHELKQAKEVGFDTEFTPKFGKLDPDGDVLCLI